MRIALTGITGRVGAALARRLAPHHTVIPLPHAACDLADAASLKRALETLECDVFLNPAAITSLEVCEENPALATRVNAEAPGEIAAWATGRGVRLIHFSTDYVFGGETPGLRLETESAEPVNVYGASKLAGESAVLSHPGHLVLRVSWVFGPEKPSFIDQMFDAALAGRPLAAVADKWALPTFTKDLAEWTDTLVGANACGLMHACNAGEPVSWHGMAETVVREMADCGALRERPEVSPLKLSELPFFRAARPRFTAMDTRRLAAALGKPPRPWPEALAEYIRARCAAL